MNPAGYGQEKGGTPLEFVVPDGDDGFVGMFVRRAADGVGLVSARGRSRPSGTCGDTGKLKVDHGQPSARSGGSGSRWCTCPRGRSTSAWATRRRAAIAGKGYGGTELNWFYRHDGDVENTPTPLRSVTRSGRTLSGESGHTATDTPPYRVTGAGAIPTGRQKGRLWAVGITPEDGGEIPAAFPNGYAAFYCMKFPCITAGQYAGFLNTLTEAQAKPRYYAAGPRPARSNVPGRPRTTPMRPRIRMQRCPWLSWADGAAFAAWAGLRPMTELEYEKMHPRAADPRSRNDATPSYWGVDGVQGHVHLRAAGIGRQRRGPRVHGHARPRHAGAAGGLAAGCQRRHIPRRFLRPAATPRTTC